ncbi:MAG: VCBS repeat-containing protein [Calditrichaeota bacterium]|nr:MAG: VCBS repeat-containing protein [Calditrichota bacterium]
MKKVFFVLLLTSFLIPSISHSQDLGVPDSIKIVGDTLVVGQSRPLAVVISNDRELAAHQMGFAFDFFDSGAIQFDSVVFIGRMADPNVLPLRSVNDDLSSAGHDFILRYNGFRFLGNYLPVGSDSVSLLYFTGLSAGTVEIDSNHVEPTMEFHFLDYESNLYEPFYQKREIIVIEGTAVPSITLSDTLKVTTTGTPTSFTVTGTSSEGFPVTTSFIELTGYDQTMSSSSSPTYDGNNPGSFSWTPSASDIGIWKAVFQACDTAENCVTKEIVIEVIDDASYFLPFSESRYATSIQPTELACADLNNDGFDEAVVCGYQKFQDPRTIFSYDIAQDTLYELSTINNNFIIRGVNFGYLNTDDYYDMMFLNFNPTENSILTSYLNNQDNTFTMDETQSEYGNHAKKHTLTELNNDQYLDYVSVALDQVIINWGDATSYWGSRTDITVGTKLLSLNCGDFNMDGYNDLAIGDVSGLYILLNNQNQTFTQSYFYPLAYTTEDIEVTNHGSDFNNDNLYDLCIAVPSIGGANSDLVVFYGNSNGSFTSQTVRTVKGQIFSNTIHDFNGDGELDIAFVNGAYDYISILFGDGAGNFDNEVRYFTTVDAIRMIEGTDYDLDGDVDLLVANSLYQTGNFVITFENTHSPVSLSQTNMTLESYNNAEIELVSPSDKIVNSVKNTIVGSNIDYKNIDNNQYIDKQLKMYVAEEGVYNLHLSPRVELPANESFSVKFELNNQQYAFADNQTMNSNGYDFNFVAGSIAPIIPRPGSFIQNKNPIFFWEETGAVDFQISTDILFNSLILETTLNEDQFSLPFELSVSDTTQYFWRVKPTGQPDYTAINVFNLVPASSGTNCCVGIRGNIDNDPSDIIMIADLVFLVDFMFSDGHLPECFEEADLNADLELNIGDIVYLVDYMFGVPTGTAPLDCP